MNDIHDSGLEAWIQEKLETLADMGFPPLRARQHLLRALQSVGQEYWRVEGDRFQAVVTDLIEDDQQREVQETFNVDVEEQRIREKELEGSSKAQDMAGQAHCFESRGANSRSGVSGGSEPSKHSRGASAFSSASFSNDAHSLQHVVGVGPMLEDEEELGSGRGQKKRAGEDRQEGRRVGRLLAEPSQGGMQGWGQQPQVPQQERGPLIAAHRDQLRPRVDLPREQPEGEDYSEPNIAVRMFINRGGYSIPKHDFDDLSNSLEAVRIPWERPSECGVGVQPPSKWTYLRSNAVKMKSMLHINSSDLESHACSCPPNCLGSPPCRCQRSGATCGLPAPTAYTPTGTLTDEFLELALLETRGAAWTVVTCTSDHCKFQPWKYVLKQKSEDVQEKEFVQASNPCKGHVVRTAIRECNILCACWERTCANRVVQSGLSVKLKVFARKGSSGIVWGVCACEQIQRGSFLCEFVGEVQTRKEFSEWQVQELPELAKLARKFVVLDALAEDIRRLGAVECPVPERKVKALVINATHFGNVARFIRRVPLSPPQARASSEERLWGCGRDGLAAANVVDIPVQYDSSSHNYYHVALFASQDIAAGEELVWFDTKSS